MEFDKNPQLHLHMDPWKGAKDVFETTDNEISDQEAMEIVADWSVAVSSTRTPDKNFCN